MTSHWMRLSPQQAIGWYCVPKDIAHQPEHAFYGLNLTEEDMRNGWWMTNREFFAVLASPQRKGLRLHIATIDGDSFGEDEDFNVLDPDYKMGIGAGKPHAILELAEILLQHAPPPSQSISPTIFKQVSHDELTAKASRGKFEGFRNADNNSYYQVLTGESDQDEQFVRLVSDLGRLYISFYRFKFDGKLSYQTAYLDVNTQALWEFAYLLKKEIGAAP
jgi:hypothetical protein